MKLSTVAPIQRRPVEAMDNLSYPIIAVRSFGRGTFHHPDLHGSDITWQKLFQVRAGDLLISNIKAWEGAVAVVGSEDDGRFCSHRYLTCVADQAQVLPKWLGLYFSTAEGVAKLAEASPGTADRNRTLSQKKLAAIEVPLPSLDEQRRIVGRIEKVRLSMCYAQMESANADKQVAGLERRAAASLVDSSVIASPIRRLGDLVVVRGGGTPSKSNPLFWDGSVPWITPKDMKVRRISDAIDHISDAATLQSPAKLIDSGAVLIVVRGMILAHTVPSAVLLRQCAINQDMKALIPSSDLSPEFLCYILWAWNDRLLEMVEKSTHDTRKLETPKLLNFSIPLPSLSEQQSIVSKLDALRARVNAVKAVQAERTKALDALLPAILDRAFRGEL
ncbi:restriction endonuclease subunit S [Azospirillum sp. HJ39]|uniref:restriction endonuclease subunit S n=1 Tax=Azospirillum sp. HJ39 TaxID=3159496 RepID=UPI003556E53D